jgi:hypothetical protein
MGQFMEAMILQGVSTFNFLTSGVALLNGMQLGEAQRRIHEIPPKPVSDVLNKAFFDMLDAVYKKHLYGLREFFGLSRSSQRDREKWAKAMDDYWVDLCKEVKKWSTHRKMEIRNLRTSDSINQAQIETVLDKMVPNLIWITKGLFNSRLFGMEFPTPAPLLSPMFLLDVGESVTALRPWLDLVWRWIDPYLMSGSATHYSYGTTLSIVAALDRLEPITDTLQIVWALASEIFCMRTDALVALRNIDMAAKMTPVFPKFTSIPRFEDMYPAKDLSNVIIACLKAWRASSSKEVIKSGALQKDKMPSDGSHNVLQLPKGAVIINALTCTYYPWAACPNNQVSGRLTSTAQKAVQLLWSIYHQEETYGGVKGYWVLRAALEAVLSETTGFETWWDSIECPFEGDPRMPSSPQGSQVVSTRGQLSRQSKAQEIQLGTEKAIHAIVKILCTEESGAIPVPVDDHRSDFRPFEEVYDAALALFEAMAVASFRAQSVYTNPRQERLSIISNKERAKHLASFDIPDRFKPAPFEVIETHYAAFDASQLSGLDVFGPGSLAFQKRKSLVESKGKKPKITAEDDKTLGTVLVEGTPVKKKAVDFSSPVVDDDLMFKVNIIKGLHYEEDDIMLDEEEED